MSNTKKVSTLGGKIKKARKDVGLSQKELGKLLKVTDKAISTYEVNRATPPIEKLREISKITYKPIAYFLEDLQGNSNSMVTAKLTQIERELNEIRQIISQRSDTET